jgi:signal transduction histidine kinase
VMGVQAGAARRALASDPERAAAPLRMIETSSREAVAELHRLLGFLRRVDDVDPDGLAGGALDPQPGLARLDDLRAQLASAGLALRLTLTGTPTPLAPAVDLSAYRILQEALTNCLKYAGVDQAEVEIEYCPDLLRIAVRDRGRGPTPAATSVPRSGAGLVGMAERAALLGGTARHGARPGGGFQVEAELPYHGVVAAAPSALPVMERTA